MIAGYLTATTTDLARVVIHEGKPRLVHHKSFLNQDYSDFTALLDLYLRKTKGEKKIVCVGVAGPVIDNKVTATNIPWKINGNELKKTHSFKKVTLVNDLVATASGLFQLDEDKMFTLNKGKKVKNGNIGLVAAGDGLGEGLIFYDGAKYCPYASEGGHVDFSPGNQMETELWEYLYSHQGYVEAEDVISLLGLQHIYEFMLAANRSTKADWFKKARDKPGKIIEQALSGKDEIAVKTLDMFVDCYAAESANLALKGITLGGIYLGGQIAPRIITALEKGRFMERFVKKGKLASLLNNIPIGVIIEEKTALIGAASLAAESTTP